MNKGTFFPTVATLILGGTALGYLVGKEGGIKPAAKKLGQSRVGSTVLKLVKPDDNVGGAANDPDPARMTG